MAASSATEYNAVVTRRMEVSPRLAIFRVKPDEPVAFTPGQFTVLGLRQDAPRVPEADPEEVAPGKEGSLIRRAYSISSGSNETEFLEFYVSLVTSGRLTPRLFSLQEGDRLFMGKKAAGVFTLDRVPGGQRILLVGTGTGLAPYVSMVRTLSLGISCPVTPLAILHGASYSWDLGYRSELEMLREKCPNFRYTPVISRPQADPQWQGVTGRLTEHLEPERLEELAGFAIDPTQTHIFLCGHPNLVEDGLALFQERGFETGTRKEPGNLHAEKYW